MNSTMVRVFCFQLLFLFSLQRSGQGQGCSGWMSPQYMVFMRLRAPMALNFTPLSLLMGRRAGRALLVVGARAFATHPKHTTDLAQQVVGQEAHLFRGIAISLTLTTRA